MSGYGGYRLPPKGVAGPVVKVTRWLVLRERLWLAWYRLTR